MTDGSPADPALVLQLVDGLPVAAVVARAGRIIGFNRAAETLYLRSAAEALGADLVDLLFDVDDRHDVRARLADPSVPSADVTQRVRRADGALLVSTFRIEHLAPDVVCWIATDTMDQGLAEQERAVLLSAEHAARAEAEAARFRLNVLSTASSAMTATLDLDQLLEQVADTLVPTVGDLCVIEFIDEDGELTTLHVRHRDPSLAADLATVIRRQPIDRTGADPIARVLRSGRAERFEGRERTAAAVDDMARDDEQARAYAALGLRSTIIAPIQAGGLTRGLLALSAVERPLHDDDLAMVTEVAQRLSLAVGNVEAYVQERHRAETLQLALLPTLEPVDGIDVAVRYLAATEGSEVGGDWYDVIPQGPDALDVVIGDVVGHDVHAAVQMGQIRNALRAYACRTDPSPASTLLDLDTMVRRLRLELATAVVAHLDLTTETLTWSNAGHLPPLLLVDGEVSVLDDRLGTILGIGSLVERTEAQVPFPPGATLVLYTDGAVEDRRHPIDDGIAALSAAVVAGSGGGTEGICDAIVAATLQHGPERRDDIAILVLTRR